MRFEVARDADDPELRRLLRENPMEGEIRLSLEREPNVFLAATTEGDTHQVVVARDEGSRRILGFGSRTIMTAFVNGQATGLGYLSQLRIDRTQPRRKCLLQGGYAKLRELHADGETPFYVTTIVADNWPARRILAAGLDGLPTYEARGLFLTLAIPVRRRRRLTACGCRLGRGSAETVDEVIACLQRNGGRYQFARRWTREDLLSGERTRGLDPADFYLARRDGDVVGCLALWNQLSFKQAVVHGYSRRLALVRPLINPLSPWLPVPRLPAPGGAIRNAFISHAAVDDDDSDILVALLTAAYNDAVQAGFDYLAVGLAQRNPLADAVKRAFPHREYASVLYVVYWDDGARAAGQLDDRVPHLEVATL